MFRYLAFCWNRKNEEQARSALALASRVESFSASWRIAFCTRDIRVYTVNDRLGASGSIPLGNGSGVVLGTLFERTDVPRSVLKVDRDESARIAGTGGRRLVDKYWGRYVAFVQNQNTGHVWIIRDPTGALPCLRTEVDGVQIFAAHAEDCCNLRASGFSINWPYVRARILVPYIETTATGLIGVSQLPPGTCVELHGSDSSEMTYWNPFHVAESTVLEDEAEAVERLRSEVSSSVHAWASSYKGIVLKLSGGLDSAIVLGCLSAAEQRPNVICANDYSYGADTDERHYARLAAERAGFELIERARDLTAGLECALRFRRVSTPVPSHFWVQAFPTNEEIAARNSATALFTGNGGDQLFLATKGHWPLVDHLYCHGPQLRTLRMARDFAYLQPPARSQSWWSLMRQGVRLGLLCPRRREPLRETPDFSEQTIVKREVIDAFLSEHRSWLPPWFKGCYNLPPGKIAQVHRLSFPNSFYPISRSQPETLEPVHPLLSQPVIELCLRIRTYVLMSGNTDRTAARKAFGHLIPPEIAKRRTKGGINDYAIDLLLRNVSFIREFLLDGELVRHKLLDRPVLEDMLGEKNEGLRIGTYQVLDLLQVEAWVQAWTHAEGNTMSRLTPNKASCGTQVVRLAASFNDCGRAP